MPQFVTQRGIRITGTAFFTLVIDRHFTVKVALPAVQMRRVDSFRFQYAPVDALERELATPVLFCDSRGFDES